MGEDQYLGVWITADGEVRHELLADGYFHETRRCSRSDLSGRYEVCRGHINYWENTGSVSSGVFVTGNELHHAERVLYKAFPSETSG